MGKKDIRKQLTESALRMLIYLWNPHRPQGPEQLTRKASSSLSVAVSPLHSPQRSDAAKGEPWENSCCCPRSGNIWKVLRRTPVRGSAGCAGCVCRLGSCWRYKCSLVLGVLREHLLRWCWGDHGVVGARSRRQPEWPSLRWETRVDFHHRIQGSS